MLSLADSPALAEALGWIDPASRRSLVVAVSGGSDSTALLVALKRHLDAAGGGARIVAVTVDHGLRAESAAEAERVARFCAGLGVSHVTKTWRGDKPVRGVAAAAREARYALLAKAARAAGADMVLTGHTADDQAETVLMRSGRGPGPGLAGMAGAALFDRQTWIVRPFLGHRRETLRCFLAGLGIGWIDDPTNADTGQERVRVRRRLASDPGGFKALIATARRERERRARLSVDAAALVEARVDMAAPGLLRVDTAFPLPDESSRHATAALMACAGGARYLPSDRQVKALARAGRGNLSGAVLTRRKHGFFIHRERRGSETPGFAGDVFDGRFVLAREAVEAGWCLALAGTGGAACDPEITGIPKDVFRAAGAMEARPVFSGRSATPGIEPAIFRHLAPFDHFLPEFDLTLANAMAALFGRESYPPPPSNRRDHAES
ncbi:MAG: tRNA lysidine(34) synthetase TilS [Rhizobiaceae bacterium]